MLERNHPEELVWINVLRALRELHNPSDQQILSQKLDDSDDDGEDSDDIPEGTSESGAVDEEATAPSSLPQQGEAAHDSQNQGDPTDESAQKKRRVGKAHGDSPAGRVPGNEQSSMREDNEVRPSLWLVYVRSQPERRELWCGTYGYPDNLGKRFGEGALAPLANVYPLGNDLRELNAGRGWMGGMRGSLIFRGPRTSGRLVVGDSYDPDDQLIYCLQSLPPTVRTPSSVGSASTSTIKGVASALVIKAVASASMIKAVASASTIKAVA